MTVTGDTLKRYLLVYPEEMKTVQLANCWKDTDDATEYGAACVGILLSLKLKEIEVIERAVKKQGVDYWMGKADDGVLFQKKARLEVSGISKGNEARKKQRFDEKSDQTTQSDGCGLRAYVSVTEFSAPTSKFAVI